MFSQILTIRPYLFLIIGLSLATGNAWSFDSETHKQVGGMNIYIGLIEAKEIRIRNSSTEIAMHGGAIEEKDRYHLVVALFDIISGNRITDAKITANIANSELGWSTKKLERMLVNDQLTYGNYFVMPKNRSYQIRLTLDVPGKGVNEAIFDSSMMTAQ